MNVPLTIASIVEGHGETVALPILLQRIASEVFDVHHIVTPRPHRVPRTQMNRGEELSRAARLQSGRTVDGGGVLLVADIDDDSCALELAESFRKRAGLVPLEVVVAIREFEAWYLAGIESLRAHPAVRDDATIDFEPESRRDAKGALSGVMTEPYRETRHQPAFAQRVDLTQARRARSFEHLVACVGRILTRPAERA